MTSPGDGEQRAADGAGGSLPSPLDAVDDMRAAAKWMLAAAGAVGAALISGGPLVAVGQVHGGPHIFLAVLGLALAVGGVGVAIWFTSNVLMPRLTTPAMLQAPNAPPAPRAARRAAREPADLPATLNGEPGEFLGEAADSVEALFRRQEDLRRQRASALQRVRAELDPKKGERDPQRIGQLRASVRRVEQSLDLVGRYVRYVLALGHAWQIKAALQRARLATLATLAGAGLVIVGAVLFFIATGSNGPAYVPVMTTTPTAVPTTTPTTVP